MKLERLLAEAGLAAQLGGVATNVSQAYHSENDEMPRVCASIRTIEPRTVLLERGAPSNFSLPLLMSLDLPTIRRAEMRQE